MAIRENLIQARSLYVGVSPNVAPAASNLGVDGSIGIGTPTPISPLSIYRGPGSNAYIEVSGGGSTLGVSSTLFGQGEDLWGYVWNRANQPIVFGANNSLKMTLSAAGNLAIGTSTPTEINGYKTLTLDGVSGTFTEYRQNGTPLFRIGVDGSRPFLFGMTNAPMDFYTSGIERMRITGGGLVGIGTSNPSSKLHVVGTILTEQSEARIQFKSTGGIGREYDFIGGNDGLFYFYDRTANVFRYAMDSSGNFSIGTTIPNSRLHVETTSSSPFRMVRSGDSSYGFELGSGDAGFYNYGTSNYVWYAKSNGNVGIGTTNPGAKLDIVSTGAGSEGLRVDGTGGGFAFVVKGGSDYTSHIRAGATIGTNYFTTPPINGLIVEGSVGIGTASPSRKLTVAGEISSNYGSNQGSLWLGEIALQNAYFTSYGILDFTMHNGGGFSNVMRIQGNGNVGIGTTNPQSKLQIGDSYNSTSGTVKLITLNTGGYYSTTPANQYNVMGFTGTVIDTSDIYSQTSGEVAKNFYMGIFSDVSYFNNNRFSIVQGGVERLTVQGYANSGNVGIGTAFPGAKLEVASSASGTTMLVGRSSGNSSIKALSDAGGYLALDSTGGELILNHYSSANVWLVTGGGNVGIGTTSPGYKLDVNGAGRFIFRNNSNEITDLLLSTEPDNSKSKLSFFWYGNETASIKFLRGGNSTGSSMEFWTQEDLGATTQKMNIAGSGNVGIGTTNPSNLLHLTSHNPVQRFESSKPIEWTTDGEALGSINFYKHYGLGQGAAIRMLQDGGTISYVQAALAFYTNNNDIDWATPVERMKIKANGDIGINTSNPIYKLDVNGWVGALRYYPYNTNSSYIDGDGSGIRLNGPGYLYSAVSGGSYFEGPMRVRNSISNDANSYLQINGGTANITYFAGTVGVGFTTMYHNASLSLANKLFIGQTNNSDIGGTIYGYWDSGYQAYAGGLIFQTFNANGGFPYTMKDAMVLTGSGNMGIGTNTPNSLLSGTEKVLEILNSNVASLYLNSTTGRRWSISSVSDGTLTFWDISSVAERMRITTSGSVGIGTSYTYGNKLSVNGGISGTPSWDNSTLELRSESGLTTAIAFHRAGYTVSTIYSDDGSLVFGENGGERMRISGGKVGIGTSAPDASAILDVASRRQGFLPPRMTNSDMNAIPSPAAGLVVYDASNNKLTVFNGTSWVPLH